MFPVLALSLLLPWVQVRSETFVVRSAAGDAPARRVLAELEKFHQAVGQLAFHEVGGPEIPIDVLILHPNDSFNVLSPEINGRKVDVAGYYQRGQDRDFIVVSSATASTSVVYHELTHYFLARALSYRPIWLNEGLAEYFAAAVIRDDSIVLGNLSPERLQILRQQPAISIEEMLAVDLHSPYYSETTKANAFYSRAWALVHFLMHSDLEPHFRRYMAALRDRNADLMEFLPISLRTLESRFAAYVNEGLRRAAPRRHRAALEGWNPVSQPIDDFEARLSIGELLMAQGRYAEAKEHLEYASSADRDLPRASFYRGVLALLSQKPEARDLFVEALVDDHLGARAAVQLVALGERAIPAVRAALKAAADARTPDSSVYLALSEIYMDDVRAVEEAVRVSVRSLAASAGLQSPAVDPAAGPGPAFRSYYESSADGWTYVLSADASGFHPQVVRVVPPYFPEDLRQQRVSGCVVMNVQIAEDGKVLGLFLVSADRDVLGGLATAAVRDWTFDRGAGQIRVTIEFVP